MGEIKVLDCTLRDGGRCFGNTWGDETIKNISYGLSKAGIDIIEIGFLWYISDGICRENSTLFRSFSEIELFLCPNQNYVTYIEYEVFEKGIYEIIPKEQSSISGIRLGILKKDIENSIETMKDIIDKGYQLYVQGINIFSYSNEELLTFLKVVNDIKPYAFAIVDTFGTMEEEDLIEKFELINHNLDMNVAIALHSHNNKNKSLSLAETLIKISKNRDIVIDGTLLGIGMGAGNLNTELITQYLNKEKNKLYDIALLSKLIEKYIKKFCKKFAWGCTPISIDSAQTWRSQIEVSYITSRYKNLSVEQQRYLLAMCPINQGVTLEKIDSYCKLLLAASTAKSDYEKLKEWFSGKKIVLAGRGPSVLENKEKIVKFIHRQNAMTIYVNAHETDLLHVEGNEVWYFFSREDGYQFFAENNSAEHIITLAGFKKQANVKDREFAVHVKECAADFNMVFNDAVMWILNLLCGMQNQSEIFITGFDGDDSNPLQVKRYKEHISLLRQNNVIQFLTNSIYEDREKE